MSALQDAIDAINDSDMSPTDKNAALNALSMNSESINDWAAGISDTDVAANIFTSPSGWQGLDGQVYGTKDEMDAADNELIASHGGGDATNAGPVTVNDKGEIIKADGTPLVGGDGKPMIAPANYGQPVGMGGWLAKTFGLDVSQGLGKALSSTTAKELGLGGAGMLGVIGAMTSTPETKSETTKSDTATQQDTTSSGTTSATGSSTQDTTQSGSSNTLGSTSQDTTQSTSQATTGTSQQNTAQTGSSDTTTTGSQSQTGSSTQDTSQSGTSNTLGSTTQDTQQTNVQDTAQTSETTLPQWYLDLVKKQAEGVDDISKYNAFTQDLNNLGEGKKISDYMNTYTEAAVNPVLKRMQEDQAAQQQAFDAQRVSRGGFGSARADLLKSQMMGRQEQTTADTLAQAQEKAFGQAQAMAKSDLDRAYEDWKLLQMDDRNLASSQATTLAALKPGQITSTVGTTAGSTVGSTLGTSAQDATTTNTGTTTGTTAQDTTNTQNVAGTTANTSNVLGATTGTTDTTGLTSTLGTSAQDTTTNNTSNVTGTTAQDTATANQASTLGTTAGNTTQNSIGTDPNAWTKAAGAIGMAASLAGT